MDPIFSFALYLASALTFCAALLHFACLYWGAAGFRFLGAGESLVKKAEAGHWYPKFTALFIGLILTIFAIYAFCAARGAPRLAFSQILLTLVAALFLIRALAFPLIKSRFAGNSDLFWYVSSSCCLVIGSLYALGVYSFYI